MPNQREITVILLMAGKGSRMGCKEKKQFLPFQGKPLYYSALQKFCSWDRCKEILLILSKEDKERVEGELKQWREELGLRFLEGESAQCKEELAASFSPLTQEGIVVSLIEGGAERYWSVYSALEFLKNRESNREKHKKEQEIKHGESKNLQNELSLFIHDGARPCFSLDLCERIYQARKSYGAVIPGLPVTDTIKRVEKGIVQESVDRSSLYRIQTPQAFSFPLLWEAYNAFLEKKEEGLSITDDAMMVEAFTKEQPYLVLGEEQNQKITVPEDLIYLKFMEEYSKK
ncbi:2-C-methyl-D-erythritol 4-phosphate cytidylyltransferase [Oribacterium sinus]|jgi:2-C-methyl-D-erythritol 4-phosphate cytidylyltransferase|uniref:Putative 2-C-methyl-D-erythritol 4-phosphate cytidylyltransferase n=1 Tax=Oribacterium sinus F0268 TaxID=585501 RepID=C2KX70_9FIRM|nr:IspD/TarI family cytidylyltransferase [Oribacterium sinus]EEJ51628.1 putative 2-C-methyl-D-erythritol 4-phosphate cytidylyltransferase [Oribacterium sinus F0268]